MVRKHSLTDTGESVAIFTDSVEKDVRRLDATDSREVLTALINCLESPAPESVIEKSYETCRELQQLRQGDLRIYVTLFTEVPKYEVLWVFAVKRHRYRNLGKFDAEACRKARKIRKLTDTVEAEQYLSQRQAMTVRELRQFRREI